MWAMMPRLRILLRSGVATVIPFSENERTTEAQRHRGKIHREETKEEQREPPTDPPASHSLVLLYSPCVFSLCLCASVVRSPRPRLPREVREGLVRLGHLDRVLALGHGLALTAVGGHQFVGQAQKHRPAGL